MKRLFLLFIASTLISMSTIAQDFESLITFSWDVNVPLSNRDYVQGVSTVGFHVGYRKMINEKFYMGFDFTNSSFHDYVPRQTYYTESGAYTTDLHKYVYTYGLTISGDYFFRSGKRLIPYAGFNIGGANHTYRVYYNIYSTTDTTWGLLLRPEAGAIFKLDKDGKMCLNGTVHYDYSTSKSTEFNYSGFSSVGFQLGITFGIFD